MGKQGRAIRRRTRQERHRRIENRSANSDRQRTPRQGQRLRRADVAHPVVPPQPSRPPAPLYELTAAEVRGARREWPIPPLKYFLMAGAVLAILGAIMLRR